jgi:RHS repeat-associated protein
MESGWQYKLDANGNTLSRLDAEDRGRLYTYNSHNRLVIAIDRSTMPAKGKNRPPRIVDTHLSTYSYNGLGQRVSKDINGSVSRFVYSTDGKLMAEIDEAGVVTREYVYLNKQLLAVLDYAVAQGPVDSEVIVDNGNPPVGWISKSSNKDYGEGYLYSSGGSNSSVRWTPVLEAGEYEVYAWYVRNPKNSSNVQYKITHNSQSDVVAVDQTVGGGAWQLLDSYSFNGTGDEYLEVSDSSGGTSADAVKLVKLGGAESTVTTTVSYIHNDHLGTPRVMTDEAGNVVWRALYDPFGEATVDPSSIRSLNARFPGQYFDSETGLHYNYYRYYDPAIGRYLVGDPRGIILDFNDPKRHISATMGVSIPTRSGFGSLNNSYNYVGNNPANRVDPTGEVDPVTAGVIIWGLLYFTHAGDFISEPNGNVWGEPDRQDGVCTLGPIFGPMGDSCFPARCQRHDECYSENQCTASSWTSSVLGGTKSCNRCNSGFFK